MFARNLKLILIVLLLSANTVFGDPSSADETQVWTRAPIQITLPVGEERFLTFPMPVQFGYNTARLPSSVLRVENDNQTVYLLAKKPFNTERVEARLSNGEIILLDMNASLGADDNPVDIVLPSNATTLNGQNTNASTITVNDVALLRYAIQQLYAPETVLDSLESNPLGITRFPMETSHVVPLFEDGSAIAMPLASWHAGNEYVTAVQIKNALAQPLTLNAQTICGDWQAASFFPQNQIAAHTAALDAGMSTLFVVSNVPFNEAIKNCLTN